MASLGMLSKVHIPSSARTPPPKASTNPAVRSRFMGSLSHEALRRGETLENGLEASRRCRQFFRQHPRLSDDRHEVRVAVPPRNEMQVHVLFDARAGRRG